MTNLTKDDEKKQQNITEDETEEKEKEKEKKKKNEDCFIPETVDDVEGLDYIEG